MWVFGVILVMRVIRVSRIGIEFRVTEVIIFSEIIVSMVIMLLGHITIKRRVLFIS
jgi:hypothetical protein